MPDQTPDAADRLAALRSGLEDGIGSDDLPSAADVRRRGDRRHRRHQAYAIAGVAAALALIVAPVATMAGHDDISEPAQHGMVTRTALSPLNLPVASDIALFPDEAGSVRWRAATTDRRAALTPNPCFAHTLPRLGATTTWRRVFQANQPDDSVHATAAQFSSGSAAGTAYDTLLDDLRSCPHRVDGFQTGQRTRVEVDDTPDRAEVVTATLPGEPGMGANWGLHTGLLLAGDRVLVMTHRFGAQDSMPPVLQRTVVKAATRLTDTAK